MEHLKKNTPLLPKFQHLECQDHTVSHAFFKLSYHTELSAYQTVPEPSDLSKYYESKDYISHSDRNTSVVDRIYQWVRKYTLKRKLKLINSLGVGKTILDVGCGTGDFIKTCTDHGWKAVGVEPNDHARQIAINKSERNIYEQIDLIDEKFNLITLWHVLEHVSDITTYVRKLQSLLTEDGRIIIAVPNYNSYDASYYKNHWAAFDVPRHLWHFSQRSMAQLFAPLKMKVVATKGMKFDAYYVSLLSEKYMHGKMNYLKAFRIGFKSNRLARKSKEYSSLIYVLKNEH